MNDTRESDIDCHIIIILSVISFLAVIFLPDGDYLRMIFAMPMLLFYPGYLAIAALFYNKKIDPIFHIVLGIILNIAIVSLIALGLGFTVDTIGIRLVPSTILIFIFTVGFYLIRIAGSISFHKKQQYFERKIAYRKYKKQQNINIPQKTIIPSLSLDYSAIQADRTFIVMLVIIMVIAGYGLYTVSQPIEQNWTDLYLYSSNPSNPFKITSNWTLNKNLSVYIKIVNHEKNTVLYTIIGNTTVLTPKYNCTTIFNKKMQMVDQQSFEWNITFKFTVKGKNTVQFNLFKDGVYNREVHAIIIVA